MYEENANRIVVFVDASRLDAWRREPYFSDLKNWAVDALSTRGQVVVCQGADTIVVLPDREKNLGRVRDDQLIVLAEVAGPTGPMLDALALNRDDPLLQRTQSAPAP